MSVESEDRAEIWDVIATKRDDAGDVEGADRARECAGSIRSPKYPTFRR